MQFLYIKFQVPYYNPHGPTGLTPILCPIDKSLHFCGIADMDVMKCAFSLSARLLPSAKSKLLMSVELV